MLGLLRDQRTHGYALIGYLKLSITETELSWLDEKLAALHAETGASENQQRKTG